MTVVNRHKSLANKLFGNVLACVKLHLNAAFFVCLAATMTGCGASGIGGMGGDNIHFQHVSDPDHHLNKFRTFSTMSCLEQIKEEIPDSAKKKLGVILDPLIEKNVLRQVEIALVNRGYELVELDQDPDLTVWVMIGNVYQESYVPPSTRTRRYREPDTQVTTSYNQHARIVPGHITNNFESYRVQGNSYATTTIPGKVRSETYTLPGYYTGAYYSSLNIAVGIRPNDRNGLSESQTIWQGEGILANNNLDIQGDAVRLVNIACKNIRPRPLPHTQPHLDTVDKAVSGPQEKSPRLLDQIERAVSQ